MLRWLRSNSQFWIVFTLMILPHHSALGSSNNQNNEESSWSGWLRPAAITVGAVATGVGVVAGAPVVLTAAGFTGAGIAAGSLAATLPAYMGAVSAGSAFAALQSAGAGGLGSLAATALGVGGAAVGAGVAEKITRVESADETCEK